MPRPIPGPKRPATPRFATGADSSTRPAAEPTLETTPAPPRTLPAFTPVPRKCQRFDGWTPERQRGFIEALADTGSPKHAARTVGMTPEGAYLLRRHPEGESFRKGWEAALALGIERLEDVALERAIHGIEVPFYSYGKLETRKNRVV